MTNFDKIERNLNGSEAIAEAIFQEMQKDGSTILIGEDVWQMWWCFWRKQKLFF